MSREGSRIPAVILAAALGGTAVANTALEVTGAKAEFNQRNQDRQEFFKHLGLMDEQGNIKDKEAFNEWRLANDLIIKQDGGLQTIDIEKENSMIQAFIEKKNNPIQ